MANRGQEETVVKSLWSRGKTSAGKPKESSAKKRAKKPNAGAPGKSRMSKAGEPWKDEAGKTKWAFERAFGFAWRVAGGKSATQAEAVAQAIWESELSDAERAFGERMASHPSVLCAWLFAGVGATGLDPELAEWRACARQKRLAAEMAKPWPAFDTGGWDCKRPILAPNALGGGWLARVVGFGLRHAAPSALAVLNAAAAVSWLFAAPSGLGKILESGWIGPAEASLLALCVAEMLAKAFMGLEQSDSIALWVWARRKLPGARGASERKASMIATAHWLSRGLCEETAKKMLACGESRRLVGFRWSKPLPLNPEPALHELAGRLGAQKTMAEAKLKGLPKRPEGRPVSPERAQRELERQEASRRWVDVSIALAEVRRLQARGQTLAEQFASAEKTAERQASQLIAALRENVRQGWRPPEQE
jgi:hypothetical protein